MGTRVSVVLARVSLGSLGGTITMLPTPEGGIAPALGAEQLVACVPGLGQVVDVTASTLYRKAAPNLTGADIASALNWARAEVDAGAVGVVLAQGTDTIEETSFLADLWWERPEPLVFTGAMRSPAAAGADGPANLLAACLVAASPAARDQGALVVFDDAVHAAALVRKVHSWAIGAFASPGDRRVGEVREGEVFLAGRRQRRIVLGPPAKDPNVPILGTFSGDPGTALTSVLNAADGLVVAGFGAGHVSEAVADVIGNSAGQVPIVVATRADVGGTLTGTYGYPGSELDLARRGAILAGSLAPAKARTLLWAALAAGMDRVQIANLFH